jgi:hypothetical protein
MHSGGSMRIQGSHVQVFPMATQLLGGSRYIRQHGSNGLSEADVRQHIIEKGLVPVVHLTTSMAIAKIADNGWKNGNGYRSQLHRTFDRHAPAGALFRRTDATFAYPNRAAIDWSKMVHLGEVPLCIFVDPMQAYVADMELLDVCKAQRYFDGAVTLFDYHRNGNPGFDFSEVVIPAGVKRFLFVPPRDFTPLPVRKIEKWEKDFEAAIRPHWPLPESQVHPWEHALRVADNAVYISSITAPEYQKAAIIGSYLHDIGRVDDDDKEKIHGQRGAEMSGQFLPASMPDVEGASILFAIRHHSDREAPNGLKPITENYPEISRRGLVEGIIAAIWDADRLDLRRLDDVDVDESYLSTDAAKGLLREFNG